MRFAILVAAGAALTVAGACAQEEEAPGALPRLTLEGPVTVSGLSSGAFFAHQFHIAFSGVVEGAGIVAGGPYACADDVPAALWTNPARTIATALSVCTHAARDTFDPLGVLLPEGPDADASLEAVREAWRDGGIDDPDRIADDVVWLFHGGRDPVVPEGAMEAVVGVYRGLGVSGGRLRMEERGGAGHGLPVEGAVASDFGTPACGETERPYLIDCDLDAAGALLSHLLGGLDPPAEPVREHLMPFDQTPFFDAGDASTSLADEGWVYVPGRCAAGEACRLHVAFHGCDQNTAAVGDDFVADAGYNGWAEANGIVVLYPQTVAWRPALDPTGLTGNPRACWDWWGYSADEPARRDAPQMRAVRRMVEALGAGG